MDDTEPPSPRPRQTPDPPTLQGRSPGAETLRQLGERGLIARVRARAPEVAPGTRVGIGDDTAVLDVRPGSALLATTDLVIEDVHFRLTTASPRDVGWKALAVNMSDIAAMGGRPRWALVALAVPSTTPVAEVDAFYEGLDEAASPHGVLVVGGDTSASPDGWMINVTVLGEHPGVPRLRSMARAGDAIAVTGSLGRSAAGLALLEAGCPIALEPALAAGLTSAHLRPIARVREGQWLATQEAVHALMDCSDGLATDLGHICRESRVGARISLDRVPVDDAVREAASALGQDALAWAIGGGEDYELLVTGDAETLPALAEALQRATGTRLTLIGEIAAGPPEITWLDERGAPVPMAAGFEHFHDSPSLARPDRP